LASLKIITYKTYIITATQNQSIPIWKLWCVNDHAHKQQLYRREYARRLQWFWGY